MFKKLLKYDMLSVWRFWWILAISVLSLSVVGSFVLRFVITYIENPNFSFFTGIAIFFLVICFLVIFSSAFATELFIYLRFYKNFFTDEGYLTFTLPVSRRQLYLSKMLNALIWQSLHVLLLIACAAIFLLFAPPAKNGLIDPTGFVLIGQAIAAAWDAMGGWLIVYVLEVLLLIGVSQLFNIGMIHFCITIGSIIAKKAKLLAAIGIYYGINMAFSMAMQILGTIAMMTLIDGFAYFTMDFTLTQGLTFIAMLLLIITAMMAVLAALLNCVTLDRIERRLNLA
ncbi:MAG: hypothetical protein E7666_06375 [Ruminococcaceae bacterium]|nr:hypothetical protein [Oscillospiraceae bacterium]